MECCCRVFCTWAFSSPGGRTPCLSGCLWIRAPWSTSRSSSEPSSSKTLSDYTPLLAFAFEAAAPCNLTEISFSVKLSLSLRLPSTPSTVRDVFSSQTQHNFGSWMGITCLFHSIISCLLHHQLILLFFCSSEQTSVFQDQSTSLNDKFLSFGWSPSSLNHSCSRWFFWANFEQPMQLLFPFLSENLHISIWTPHLPPASCP